MSNRRIILPRDKHDTLAVDQLAELGYPTISPVLPDLIKWLQDANWPVARPIADLLVKIGKPVVPLLLEVLRGDDAVWKYWCLERVVRRLPSDVVADLRPDLERLAQYPSDSDRQEEVNLSANSLLGGA
jgi:Domain of unknown function (DUF5071)